MHMNEHESDNAIHSFAFPADQDLQLKPISFSNSRGLRLAGTLCHAGSPNIVILAHGFTSDRYSRGRFPQIAEALLDSGYSSLAFDFSGCGESDNDSLTAAKQTDDLRSAIEYAKCEGFRGVALWGHSLGGLICVRACSPAICTMVLAGAPMGPMQFKWDEIYSCEQLSELAATGRMTILRDGERRSVIVVEAEMLRDFAVIDPESLLRNVTCPVLMIAGDGDDEERQILRHARTALARLPAESRLEVIEGAPHGFGDRMGEVVELGRSWIAARMPASTRS
jgi:pimeloyl-ACP methyl ester carboxylesterase